MSLFSFFKKSAPKSTYMGLEVKFHTDANYFGEHGTICVSHIRKNLRERSVRFVFPGITTPPKLDLSLLQYIWEQALDQGYIPHHIESYGCDAVSTIVAHDNVVPMPHSQQG